MLYEEILFKNLIPQKNYCFILLREEDTEAEKIIIYNYVYKIIIYNHKTEKNLRNLRCIYFYFSIS